MTLQLPHWAVHCQEMWLKWLRALDRLRLAIGERFLMRYFPRPPEGTHCRRMHGGRSCPGAGRPLCGP